MINTLPIANVIMPIAFEFYIGLLLFWLIVLPLEALIFKLLEKIAFLRIFLFIFLSNLVSWVLGFIIGTFVLSYIPLFTYSYFDSKGWVFSLFAIFIVSFFMSWFIEYFFLKLFAKRFSFTHLFKTTGYANMCSYIVLYVISFCSIIIQGLFF